MRLSHVVSVATAALAFAAPTRKADAQPGFFTGAGQTFVPTVGMSYLTSFYSGRMNYLFQNPNSPWPRDAYWFLWRIAPIPNQNNFQPFQELLAMIPAAVTPFVSKNPNFSISGWYEVVEGQTIPVNVDLVPLNTYVISLGGSNLVGGGWSNWEDNTNPIPSGHVTMCHNNPTQPGYGCFWDKSNTNPGDVTGFTLNFAPSSKLPITTTPEPASIVLTATGIGILGMIGYRRRKSDEVPSQFSVGVQHSNESGQRSSWEG